MGQLESMAVFAKAAETGSFAAAGQALGMSAQSVGKHVSEIEARLGARLIHRTTRHQSLTEVGRLYLERCKVVLAEAEAADAVAHSLTHAPRGSLRVSAPLTFGTYGLMPLVDRYLQRHPDVQVDLTLTDRLVDLVDEGFEATVRIGALADSNLVSRELRPYGLMTCASPAYLAAHGTPSLPEDLARHDCIGYANGLRPSARTWPFWKDGCMREIPVRYRLLVNDSSAMLRAAVDGLGVVMGAEVLLQGAVDQGLLRPLLTDHDMPVRPAHLLFHLDRRMTPKLRAFIDMVVEDFGPAADAPEQAARMARWGAR